MTNVNPHLVANRAIKVAKIVAFCVGAGITAEQARGLITPESRNVVAQLAGAKQPSDTTWAEVIGLLDHQAERQAFVEKAITRLVAS